MDDLEPFALVFDAGSSCLRADIAGNEDPRLVIPSVVGKSRFPRKEANNEFVGEMPQYTRDLYSFHYPIQRGIVTNWDNMEKMIAHTFKYFQFKSSETPVVFSVPPINPPPNQEILAQLMFEKFDIPACCISPSHFLNLYSCGRNSAVVVDVGDGIAYAAPFYESHCMSNGIQRQDFAGQDITHCLQKHLMESGHSFTTTAEVETVKEMKEKHSYVALDYELELASQKSNNSTSCTLSDGSEIELKDEQFKCTEPLFQPSKFGFQGLVGIHEMVYNALTACEYDCRGDMMVSIMISGGTSGLDGFRSRLQKEMSAMLNKNRRVNVVSNLASDLSLSVWIGGSIFGSLSSAQPMLFSKQMYEEYGPSIFYKPFH